MLFGINDSWDNWNSRQTYGCMYLYVYLQIMSVTSKGLSKGLNIYKRLHIPDTDGSKVLEEHSGSRKKRKWPGWLASLGMGRTELCPPLFSPPQQDLCIVSSHSCFLMSILLPVSISALTSMLVCVLWGRRGRERKIDLWRTRITLWITLVFWWFLAWSWDPKQN